MPPNPRYNASFVDHSSFEEEPPVSNLDGDLGASSSSGDSYSRGGSGGSLTPGLFSYTAHNGRCDGRGAGRGRSA